MAAGLKTRPRIGTPQGRRASVRAVSLGQHLLALDELWTGELERVAEAGVVEIDDRELFTDLVGEMRGGLKALPRVAKEIRHMLDELGPMRFDQALDAIGAASDGLFAPRELLAEELSDFEPQSAAIAACDFVQKAARRETALLDDKLKLLRRGKITPGDFLLPFNCAMHLVVLGATASGTILLGGSVGPVALTLVGPAYAAVQGWKRDDCRVQLPEISFRRRV